MTHPNTYNLEKMWENIYLHTDTHTHTHTHTHTQMDFLPQSC
jgi:hypothetical protein